MAATNTATRSEIRTQIRVYLLVEDLQRQFAAYLGTPTRARGYPPYEGEHALIVEVSPALAIERVIDLAPTNAQAVLLQTMIAVARGDLPDARAAVAAGARRIDPTTLYPFLAMYQDLYWVLDDAQQREVLSLPPSAFDNDRGVWALVRTELYQLRGDSVRALAYADSARLTLEAQSHAAPYDAQRHAILGVALAYLGRKSDAIREGRRGAELLPVSEDAINAPYVQLQLARIYVLTGEPDQAVQVLEGLLARPFYVSRAWLRMDPAFRPLQGHPGFEALQSDPGRTP